MKSLIYEKALGGRSGLIGMLVLAALLLIIFPIFLDTFRLNLMGRYLSLAFVAIALVLCWGYGGILSLGQGVFWGLGGYCMAAFLKLEAARNIANEAGTDQINALTTVGLPDFMDWNQITELPWFWYPFKNFPLTLALMFLIPTVLAYIIGVAMFKRRVSGVYFAIITQALCWIMELLFVTRQGWTGGINGITDLRTLLGWDFMNGEHWTGQRLVYFITVIMIGVCIILGRLILTSKLGKLLVALRDTEDRVRFSGYDVASFKTFIFCIAAAMSALGGGLFVMNVGFMSPKLVTIEPSIYMVIFCAVGGRMSLIGAVYGTLVVSYGRTYFSEQFPELWLFALGGVFILVTVIFPKGLAGIVESATPWLGKVFSKTGEQQGSQPPAEAVGT
ncbi:urea transport system permease protein [Algisphaera agarilytica]|uniref:Urea transport system permease protein n=2 Tax=Algisphaera agarilytica TaxID=1385975 RepID=A0A7X0H8Q0_9BACT|nr:urea ABC transporter permease subunit UrtC [Algisphaera agarilytica]MBB6431352.1 urea transport system permease protein [Algisphaera agarilytica]